MVIGTPTLFLSASRMRIESISCDVVPFTTSSSGSFDTAARSMLLGSIAILSSILRASAQSWTQYSMTLSLSFSHSSSIFFGSTSCFSSPSRSFETAFRVSCFGLSTFLTAHHASSIILPSVRQNRLLYCSTVPGYLPH